MTILVLSALPYVTNCCLFLIISVQHYISITNRERAFDRRRHFT